jgi:hypothetical protein
VPLGMPQEVPARLHFWRGASGRRYVHSVYSLIDCPALPTASYVLVQRQEGGRRHPLHIACCDAAAPTLNLARIRQRGATLGANEVHVHFPAAADEEARLVAFDLRAGLFHGLAAEPSPSACA